MKNWHNIATCLYIQSQSNIKVEFCNTLCKSHLHKVMSDITLNMYSCPIMLCDVRFFQCMIGTIRDEDATEQ